MTVSTAYAPLAFSGNDSTTAFSVTWPFYTGSLVVTLIDATGVETVKTISTHYTVTGGTLSNGLPSTGTVTMLTAPATGETLRITRSTPKTQAAQWTNSGAFQAKTLESAIDKLTLIAQEAGNPGSVNDGMAGDVIELVTSGATNYWDGENQILRNLADPTASTDAVTKSYGDTNYGGAAATAAAASAASALSSSISASASADIATAAAETITEIWKGQWVTSTAYQPFDFVYNDGSSYTCTQAHTSGGSTEPGTGASWNDYWDIVVTFGTFTQTGTGAVERTFQSKCSDIFSVKDFGATGDGSTDDTVAIQKALTAARVAGGGGVYVPAGVYIVNQSLVIGTATRLYGDGRASVIKAKNPYTGANPAPFSWATFTAPLIKNYQNDVSTLTDQDITIEGIAFDWNGVTVVNGGCHSISLRYVDRVSINKCYSIGGENFTALMACRDTVTYDCVSQNASNCGIDHWDSIGNAHVINCTVRNATAQGIQFTAESTTLATGTTTDCLVMGCSVYDMTPDASSAIIFNALGSGSQTFRCRSIGNLIKSCKLGLVFENDGGQHLSLGDTFDAVTNLPIFVKNDFGGSSASRILYPHLINCDHANDVYGMVQLHGSNHSARGIKVTNTSSPAYTYIAAVLSGSTNCLIDIEDAETGAASERIDDQGTGTIILDHTFADMGKGWITTNPTPSASSGTLTSATAAIKYKKIGSIVHFWAQVSIVTNGTAAGDVILPLPFTPVNRAFGSGRNATLGTQLFWFVNTSNEVWITNAYTATYPGADGVILEISGAFEAAVL